MHRFLFLKISEMGSLAIRKITNLADKFIKEADFVENIAASLPSIHDVQVVSGRQSRIGVSVAMAIAMKPLEPEVLERQYEWLHRNLGRSDYA